jgi:hypothetical protein
LTHRFSAIAFGDSDGYSIDRLEECFAKRTGHESLKLILGHTFSENQIMNPHERTIIAGGQ